LIVLPSGTRVWLAGHTDMRKGFDGLAGIVQSALAAKAFDGHAFGLPRPTRELLKMLWFDGQGLVLAKRLKRGRFV
jgi:transposase